MARPKPEGKLDEVEVTIMRKVAPERFDVVVGVLRGKVEATKTLEKGVSLVVARGTARKSIDKQTRETMANLGLEVGS